LKRCWVALSRFFEVIRTMRAVPVTFRQVFLLATAAVVPMIPLLRIVFPLDELVLRSVRSLVGL
jgi:hypothetical protein